MNGPTEFDVIGPLRDWDRTADLHRIESPTLVTVGRFDEITPACAQTIVDGVAGARLAVFEKSGHYAHEEEPEAYVAAVDEFLTRGRAVRRRRAMTVRQYARAAGAAGAS